MLNYFRLFFDLCLFRQPAANVPKSDTLLLVTAGLVIIAASIGDDFKIWVSFSASTIQLLSLGVIIKIALSMRGRGERWVQTTTGIYGVSLILQLLAIPLLIWHSRILPPDNQIMAITLPFMIIGGIWIWGLFIIASILRQAMDVNKGMSVLIAFGMELVATIMVMIFVALAIPPPPI